MFVCNYFIYGVLYYFVQKGLFVCVGWIYLLCLFSVVVLDYNFGVLSMLVQMVVVGVMVGIEVVIWQFVDICELILL